jgi:hypothetical protein
MKKKGAKFNRDRCTINPLFALGIESRNALGTMERAAVAALLEHRATPEDVGLITAMLQSSIRAVRLTHKETPDEHEPGVLDEAQRVIMRAALAVRAARQRFDKTGTYGLDSAGRAHVIEADELIADCRKPGRITRRVWLLAHRQNLADRAGIPIPETLEGIDQCTL